MQQLVCSAIVYASQQSLGLSYDFPHIDLATFAGPLSSVTDPTAAEQPIWKQGDIRASLDAKSVVSCTSLLMEICVGSVLLLAISARLTERTEVDSYSQAFP